MTVLDLVEVCLDENPEVTNDQLSPKLDFLWLEITNRCNLECVHCYSESGPRTELMGVMRIQDWVKLIADAVNAGCERVQIIGGEPLVHPDFDTILEMCADSFASTEVFTNATALTDKKIDMIRDKGVAIATSVYAVDQHIHDLVTKRNGSHEKTMSNIENAIQKGISVRTGIIQTDVNRSEDFPALEKMLLEMGVSKVGVDETRAVGRGQFSENKFGNSPETALCNGCWSGNLCATYNGRFHPCIMSSHIDLGSVSDGVRPALNCKNAIKRKQETRDTKGACIPDWCFPKGEQCTPSTCMPA